MSAEHCRLALRYARGRPEVPVKQLCAACTLLGDVPCPTTSTVGLNTSLPRLIAQAQERLDDGATSDAHVLVSVCPDHAVDVYRGRVNGVSMRGVSRTPRRSFARRFGW